MNNGELEQIVSRVISEHLHPADISEMTLDLARRIAKRVEEKAKEM